jgi:hypothetical protein
MQMWVEAGKVYFVYAGHLLALSLPKETNNLKILTVLIRSKFLLKFMKNYKYIFASLICAILFFPLRTSAQENQSGEWIRAQSDNGEFSVEFPAGYDFYADKDGFSVSSSSRSYFLSEMRMLNAYHEKTLLSFEAYKTDSPKDVAGIFAESDERNGKETEIKVGKSKFKQVLIKKENLYASVVFSPRKIISTY